MDSLVGCGEKPGGPSSDLLLDCGEKGGGPGMRGPDGEKVPKKSLKDRLEKFDRLYDMAGKGKANIPNLKERVEELKEREAHLMEREEELETPKMAKLENNPFASDPDEHKEDMFEMGKDGMPGEPEDDPQYLTPEERAEKKHHAEKTKARMEKMKGMSTDERLEFLKKERERGDGPNNGPKKLKPGKRGGDRRGDEMDESDPFNPFGKKAKAWKSKNGDFGPPSPTDSKKEKRREQIAKLSKEERHAYIREHQQSMQEHRENMENWRETHAGYMDERREIMDQYRQISHEIREAIFANRDL